MNSLDIAVVLAQVKLPNDPRFATLEGSLDNAKRVWQGIEKARREEKRDALKRYLVTMSALCARAADQLSEKIEVTDE